MHFLSSCNFSWTQTYTIDISHQGSDFVNQDCDDDMLDDFFFTEADLKVLSPHMYLYLNLYFSSRRTWRYCHLICICIWICIFHRGGLEDIVTEYVSVFVSIFLQRRYQIAVDQSPLFVNWLHLTSCLNKCCKSAEPRFVCQSTIS